MKTCEFMDCSMAGNFTDPRLKGKMYCEHHRRVVTESVEEEKRFNKAANERQEIRNKFKDMIALRKALFESTKEHRNYIKMDELKKEMLLILLVMETVGFDNGFVEHQHFVDEVNQL